MNEMFHAVDGNLTYDGMHISSGVPEIIQLYYRTGAPLSQPDALDLQIHFEGGFVLRKTILLKDLCYRYLHKVEPMVSCLNSRAKDLFDEYLSELLREAILSLPSIENAGIYFERLGWNTLSDGSQAYVYGKRIVGKCEQNFCASPNLPDFESSRWKNPLPELVKALENSSPIVTQMAAYIALATLRSTVLESGCKLQAVAYLYGPRDSGKTTLAQSMAAFIKPVNSRNAANFFDASSTPAALRDAMVTYRDLPLIVDDLCFSAGRQTEQKRVETAAQLIRQAANDTVVTKKGAGGINLEMSCDAAVILTAEFKLDNESDIDRCIFFPILEKYNIDDRICPELLRESTLALAEWFLKHRNEALSTLNPYIKTTIEHNDNPAISHRMLTNYGAMVWAFERMMDAARAAVVPEERIDTVLNKLQDAIDTAITAQLEALESIQKSRPVANLAYILHEAYEEEMFRMAKKIDKLNNKDGIIWKDDFCLRKVPLEKFIRKQPGYQDYTATRIARELNDIGALTINESDSFQVRLAANTPRVYRIDPKVLKEHAKKYNASHS